MEGIFEIPIILSLILANGFFVATEFALVSMRPSRLEELIKENKPLAYLTQRAVANLNDMLSTCQVGITIASLLLGWLGEMFIVHRLEAVLNFFEFNSSLATIHAFSITASFILITFFHIILGELAPKTIAIQKTEFIALRASIPLFFFYYLFFPIIFIMNKITSGILRIFGMQFSVGRFLHSPEELRILIEEQNKHGNIDNAEFQMIQKSFTFSEHEAKEVMTHRLNIVGIPANVSMEKILGLIAEHNFSRYPVYEDTTDKIIGVVHVQAFIEWMANPKKNTKDKITSIMQAPVFVPETLSIEKVLQKLRHAKQHLAIVVDEYGGVAGLLTLEDIIEEIFGQIQDETDDHGVDPAQIEESPVFSMDGEAELEELKEILEGENLADMVNVRTIAGFILEKYGDLPEEGTTISIAMGDLQVEKMEGNKISRVKFIKKG
ncbi:MAG: hemolysin family protein [Leptospiraceae bacterium]|nr:HlyC/CorC family transporter [Leptospiraceae bacterium]MCK6379881.1 hemolysin family protein [Leptospiraceae bacterium]NUM40238.1 HlyC/CorC family transporter [Leptospiraceae bacterium]